MAKKRSTTIQINGRTYDALTGELLHDAPNPPPADEQTKNQPASEKSHTQNPNSAVRAKTGAKAVQVHRTTKRSQTLARQAVPPPAAKHFDIAPPPPSSGVKSQAAKHSLGRHVRADRQARAQGHMRPKSITKFTPQVNLPSRSSENQPAETPPTTPSTPTAPPLSPKQKLISEALAKTAMPAGGDTPSQTNLKSRLKQRWTPRATAVLASGLSALLLIGYVTYLNLPRMALRVASTRAGITAQLPGYTPSGFAFSGPIAYSPGQITLAYSSNTDERGYRIEQRETTWDSLTLLQNYVTQESTLYSTYQERGLTVYIFDGSTATWVNGGIWYTVTGDAGLTSEHLLKIAASL